jgi:hypothetical protein
MAGPSAPEAAMCRGVRARVGARRRRCIGIGPRIERSLDRHGVAGFRGVVDRKLRRGRGCGRAAFRRSCRRDEVKWNRMRPAASMSTATVAKWRGLLSHRRVAAIRERLASRMAAHRAPASSLRGLGVVERGAPRGVLGCGRGAGIEQQDAAGGSPAWAARISGVDWSLVAALTSAPASRSARTRSMEPSVPDAK